MNMLHGSQQQPLSPQYPTLHNNTISSPSIETPANKPPSNDTTQCVLATLSKVSGRESCGGHHQELDDLTSLYFDCRVPESLHILGSIDTHIHNSNLHTNNLESCSYVGINELIDDGPYQISLQESFAFFNSLQESVNNNPFSSLTQHNSNDSQPLDPVVVLGHNHIPPNENNAISDPIVKVSPHQELFHHHHHHHHHIDDLVNGETDLDIFTNGTSTSCFRLDHGTSYDDLFCGRIIQDDNAAADDHNHHQHQQQNLHKQQLQGNFVKCEFCEIWRRIIHTNGYQDTKLEIHRYEGQRCHAVLQTSVLPLSSSTSSSFLSTTSMEAHFIRPLHFEQQVVEFPMGNYEYVRQFLMQYSILRRKEGFRLCFDSLLPNFSTGDTVSYHPSQQGCNILELVSEDTRGHHNNGSTNENGIPTKSNAAAQRERTGKLKMCDLAKHFHLPINVAAKELGICPTVLKKICRRNGMRRWPHRKIKSIERIITTLEQTIADGCGEGDEGIRMEIAILRNEREQLCAGLITNSSLV